MTRHEGFGEMNILLNLTIKRRWFDMIASGEKREEYRSADNRQVAGVYKRLSNYVWPTESLMMIRRNGYRMDSPALAVRMIGMTIRSGEQAEHPEWGDPIGRGSHFVIIFENIIARGTYAEVKEALEKWNEK